MSRHATTTGMDGTDAAAAASARSAREFARARRHSRFVRLMKIGLPVVALLIVVSVMAALWLARSLPGNFSLAATSIEDGRLVMQDPRMSGSDSNDRPYAVIAQRAVQSLTGGNIDLEGIRAELALDERTNAVISAANGIYNPDLETLRLSDDIAVDTSDGVAVRLSSADIDLAAGSLVGSGPVIITAPNQRLESGSLAIEDGGARFTFADRVKLTLLPEGSDGEADPQTPTENPAAPAPTSSD
ncbi:LPS export ABC transporter periplasmic protein LptC [Aureimonas mangrovi]|uniref:LPS export ABC transporter periplasmic protein LptC n=1 Tax=Aureimonas mangrovi TaxID=2758041 RepID=UPI00163D46FE|nr:LPS export ABC transporter periplasmic protein LptC [Aureimonas mangrovi]